MNPDPDMSNQHTFKVVYKITECMYNPCKYLCTYLLIRVKPVLLILSPWTAELLINILILQIVYNLCLHNYLFTYNNKFLKYCTHADVKQIGKHVYYPNIFTYVYAHARLKMHYKFANTRNCCRNHRLHLKM